MSGPLVQPAGRRIELVDAGRGLALLAMAVFHFTWDLEFFGYAPPGLTAEFGWKLFARCIASTFLFLVGVSLVLAHGNGIRWRGFWRRWLMVAGAAALISLTTFFALPDDFIFFGILHEIAAASLLGLLFLRVPPLLTLLAAAVTIAMPFLFRRPLFDHPALWWVGLSTVNPRSNDYVPLFPWFGAVLVGVAFGGLMRRTGLFDRLTAVRAPRWLWPLSLAGRHSLLFYLVHQPALIGLLWLVSQVAPAPTLTPETHFLGSCASSCEAVRDASFCSRYCACMLEDIERGGLLGKVLKGDDDGATRSRVKETTFLCTGAAERGETSLDAEP